MQKLLQTQFAGLQKKIHRPYCNTVLVRVPKSYLYHEKHDLNPKKVEYTEQLFALELHTTFEQLRNQACAFWNLQQDEYLLFGHKFESISFLSPDGRDSLAAFFEHLRVRHPLLHLLRAGSEQSASSKVAVEAAKIRTPVESSQGSRKYRELKEQDKNRRDFEEANFKRFLEKYPGQKPFDKRHLRKAQEPRGLDPDTYFQTLLVNVLLLLVTILPIFYSLDYTQSFFIQAGVKNGFEPVGRQGYSGVSNGS